MGGKRNIRRGKTDPLHGDFWYSFYFTSYFTYNRLLYKRFLLHCALVISDYIGNKPILYLENPEITQNTVEHSALVQSPIPPLPLFHSWPLMKSSSWSPTIRFLLTAQTRGLPPQILKGEIDLLCCWSGIHSSLSRLHLSRIKPTFRWLNGIVVPVITPSKCWNFWRLQMEYLWLVL